MANTTTTQNDSQKAQQNLQEILRKFDQAMLVTNTGDVPRARPMAIAEIAADGSLWFITGQDTSKVGELQHDSAIVAVMQSSSKYLSVSGRAELQRDRAHIARLWKDSFKVWFSGKDDPNIVLIKLQPSEAEYWDNSGLKGLKFALQYAASRVTGKEIRDVEQSVDQHAKVRV